MPELPISLQAFEPLFPIPAIARGMDHCIGAAIALAPFDGAGDGFLQGIAHVLIGTDLKHVDERAGSFGYDVPNKRPSVALNKSQDEQAGIIRPQPGHVIGDGDAGVENPLVFSGEQLQPLCKLWEEQGPRRVAGVDLEDDSHLGIPNFGFDFNGRTGL